MATSGSYTYSVNLNTLCYASFRLLGVFNDDSTVPSTDLANAVQAINLKIKQYLAEGNPLWTVEDIVIPLIQGQGTPQVPYVLGPTGIYTTYKPLKVNYARVYNNTTLIDIPMEELSRSDFLMLGLKSAQGTPNSFCFDPQTTYANLYVYVTPDVYNATNCNIILTVQRPLQDMINPTDAFDFPIECLNVLKWDLAAEMCLEYDVPESKAQLIMQRADMYRNNMFQFSQEEASTYFTPSTARR